MNEKRFQRAHIMVADDRQDELRLLQRMLSRAGYSRITCTSEPGDVLKRFDEAEPDLLVLELHMPAWEGLQILTRLGRRRGPVAGRVPVLVLTDEADQAVRNAALRFGARDFLTRPVDVNELLLRIRNLLELRFLYLDCAGVRPARRRAPRE